MTRRDGNAAGSGPTLPASAFARATIVESRSLEHARALGAARLGLKPSEVELEILEHPDARRDGFLVRVLALAIGENLSGQLSAIEKKLGDLPRASFDPGILGHALENADHYDELLLEKALEEIGAIVSDEDAANADVAHSVKQLSLGLKPALQDRLSELRFEAVRREEESDARRRSPDGGIDVQVQPSRREAYFIFRPPLPGGTPLSEQEALRRIEDEGCIPPTPADLAKVVTRVREPRAGHCMLTLAFRPGRFILQVAPDDMELTLNLYPPGGSGEAVTADQVREAIRQRGIRVPVDEDAIGKAIASVREERRPIFDLVIARGRSSEAGVDGEVTWRIPAVEDEGGAWNLDPDAAPLLVEKGHVLAVVTEARSGQPGMTIFGRALPSRKGRPCPLLPGPSVRKDAQGQFVATGPGRVGLRRNNLAVTPFEPARAELTVDPQKTRAELALIPPVGGGAGIGIEAIERLLEERGVTFCVDYELILDLLRSLEEKKRRVSGVVAVGVPPLSGRTGFLDVPVQDVIAEMHAGEQLDHRERSALRRVRAGDTVGIWYPADPGSPGIDVTGREIPQPHVPDAPADAGPGVEREGLVYKASRDGHLVVSGDRLSVEDVYHVHGDLTMAVGNIRHNGTVIIDGNIGDNFLVQAEGEIVVRDNVGASELTAVRNVRIGNGLVGRQRGIVRAGGDAQAKFVEQARIVARGALRIQQNALQSRLESEGLLEVLGPRGGIVGGQAASRTGIRASHAGSPAGVPTRLATGFSPALDQKAALLDEEFQSIQSDLARLSGLEKAVQENIADGTASDAAGDAMRRIQISRLALKGRLKEVGIERVKVAQSRRKVEPGEIVVTGTVHPGATIAVGDVELHVTAPLQAVRFTLDDSAQQVRFTPLK